MFYNLKNTITKKRFGLGVKEVLQTPPVTLSNTDGPMILTMLPHSDVLMYIMAIKSLARFVNPAYVTVVCEPNVTPRDKKIIASQVLGVKFINAKKYRHPDLPIGGPLGGAWDRLQALSHFNKKHYVIQMDADTLCLAPPAEVQNAVEQNKTFIICTQDNQDFQELKPVVDYAKSYVAQAQTPIIQLLAESYLSDVDHPKFNRYIRGCAGFCGFAPGKAALEDVLYLSSFFRKQIGQRWGTWGTEQFTSNMLISMDPSATLLPHPKYTTPEQKVEQTVFVHYIGTYRFIGGNILKGSTYMRQAQSIIKQLKTNLQTSPENLARK